MGARNSSQKNSRRGAQMRQQSFGSTIAQRLQGQHQQQPKPKNKKQQEEGDIHYQKKVLLISFDDVSQ